MIFSVLCRGYSILSCGLSLSRPNCGFATLDGAEENKKVMKATTAVDENDDNAAFEGFISDENLILF